MSFNSPRISSHIYFTTGLILSSLCSRTAEIQLTKTSSSSDSGTSSDSEMASDSGMGSNYSLLNRPCCRNCTIFILWQSKVVWTQDHHHRNSNENRSLTTFNSSRSDTILYACTCSRQITGGKVNVNRL